MFEDGFEERFADSFSRVDWNCGVAILFRVVEMLMTAFGAMMNETVFFENLDEFSGCNSW